MRIYQSGSSSSAVQSIRDEPQTLEGISSDASEKMALAWVSDSIADIFSYAFWTSFLDTQAENTQLSQLAIA